MQSLYLNARPALAPRPAVQRATRARRRPPRFAAPPRARRFDFFGRPPEQADVPSSSDADADADVLRAWRAASPELCARWDESQPVTEWRDLRFGRAGDADAGRVVLIHLEGIGLTGNLPAALGGLTALKMFRLSGNQLTSVPPELGRLTALRFLNLGGTHPMSVPTEWERWRRAAATSVATTGTRTTRSTATTTKMTMTMTRVALQVTRLRFGSGGLSDPSCARCGTKSASP